MMKKVIVFIIAIFMVSTSGCTHHKKNITIIEQFKFTDREKLLQKSEVIDHSYGFKISNLDPSSTYRFECWSEHYQKGQLTDKLEILDQSQTFVIGDKISNGYILLSLKEYSTSLQCTLSLENDNNSVIVGGYIKESFKFKGVITNLEKVNVLQNNEMVLLASANSGNSSFGIPINKENKLTEDVIKKNDEVYLIKCKLIKVN